MQFNQSILVIEQRVQSKKKGIYVKAFNMITKISEAKTLVKCNSKDCKCKFDSLGC